jgi:general secretion pathway protein G
MKEDRGTMNGGTMLMQRLHDAVVHRSSFRVPRSNAGFTIAELITVVAIIAILAGIALPVARFGIRRQKELELRDRLRKITDAIDRYHDLMTMPQQPQPGAAPGTPPPVRPAQMQALGSEGYPKNFDELLKGVTMSDGKTVRLIRERDLVDPMTGRKEWIVLATSDDPEGAFENTCEVGGSCSADNLYEVTSCLTVVALESVVLHCFRRYCLP